MIRWMKRISPCFQGAVVGGTLSPLVLLLMYGMWRLTPRDESFEKLQWLVIVPYCLGGGILYGALRVKSFHPHSNEDVRTWLATTPWRWPLPLPFGPVELVPQDALAVGIATAWTYVVTGSVWPAIAFVGVAMTTYMLSLAEIAEKTGVQAVSFRVSAAIAAAFGLLLTPWLAGLCLVIGYLMARRGTRESLKAFHEWSHQLETEDRIPADWTWSGARTAGKLGWPYAVLNPHATGPLIPWRKALEASLLIGIWTWAVCHLTMTAIAALPVEEFDFSEIPQAPYEMFPAILGFIFGCFRAVEYGLQLTAPLSLWGRIVNRRFILPGYDRIWLVPLLVVATGIVLALVGHLLSPPLELYLPVAFFVLNLIATGAGPTIEQWRLTGEGHIHPRHFTGHSDLMITQ